jgi:hypothetical protein
MEMEIEREYRLAESTTEIVGKVGRARHAETDSLLQLGKQIERNFVKSSRRRLFYLTNKTQNFLLL